MPIVELFELTGTNVVEVVVNALENLLRFPLPEGGNQPFFGIMVAFLVVAAAGLMAQRNNVVWNSAGVIYSWVIHWYPMVCGKCMPKPCSSSTNGATMSKVFESVFPIFDREIRRQISQFCLTVSLVDDGFLLVIKPPLTLIIWISSFPLTSTLIDDFAVFLSLLGCAFSGVCAMTFWVFCGVFLTRNITTVFAFVSQAIFSGVSVEELTSTGKGLTTDATGLFRGFHSISPYAMLTRILWVESVGETRFSGATLSTRTHYISAEGVSQ